MSFKVYVYFLILFNIWIICHQDTSGYVLSDKSISWFQAAESQTQTFATPDFGSFNDAVNLLKNGEKVWVGYFQMYTAFAYVGCTSIDAHDNFSIHPLAENSPGRCFMECNRENLVGLSRDKCFCLGKEPYREINEAGCDITNGYWVAGNRLNYMSLYEKKDISGSDIASNGECFAFDRYKKRENWQKCNQLNKCVCKTKSFDIIVERERSHEMNLTLPVNTIESRVYYEIDNEPGYQALTKQDTPKESDLYTKLETDKHTHYEALTKKEEEMDSYTKLEADKQGGYEDLTEKRTSKDSESYTKLDCNKPIVIPSEYENMAP